MTIQNPYTYTGQWYRGSLHIHSTFSVCGWHTIDELADRFDLPPTAFKTCFKGVYGLPPYAYLRTFRMERAAALLRETDLRVADIGLAVGYDSPSKFTAAFKAVIGQTPTVHRRDRARYVR